MTLQYTGRVLAVVSFLLAATLPASAETNKGEALFLSMKCNKCHSTKKTEKGPTLMRIADTYGEESKLLLFFQGKSDPIVEPERAKTMRPRRRKLKKLGQDDQKALAKYVLSFKSLK